MTIKSLIIGLALSLLSISAYAGGLMMMCGGVPSGTSCTTAQITEDGASAGILTNLAARVYMGSKWVATADANVCNLGLYLQRAGTVTMNVRACLYSASASPDEPNAALACSDYIAGSTIGTSEELVNFPIAATAITNTTAYWTVLQSSAAGYSTNNVAWHYENAGTTERMVADTDGATTWTFLGSGTTLKHIVNTQ